MAKKPLPSPELLRQLLRYDPETGKLFWRKRPVGMFASVGHWKWWNTRYAGNEAFKEVDRRGYMRGVIFNRSYKSHRVIWAMERGFWPKEYIDHIDHNPSNNRIGNLRETTQSMNSRNQSRSLSNTSGVTGVTWFKRDRKWQARIMVDGKQIHLGYFDKLSDAADARAKADIQYGFHPNHGVTAP